MSKNLKNFRKEFDNFFSEEPTSNQKSWSVINQFYHFILTYMENNNITKSDLAKSLNKSRSHISQLFNKTPNLSIKKMVEIADAIGINISLKCKEVGDRGDIETNTVNFVPMFIVFPQDGENFGWSDKRKSDILLPSGQFSVAPTDYSKIN